MTIGKMLELIGGKAGVSCGRFHYGDAFEEPSVHADKVEDIRNTLVKHGFSYSGKDFLYSGLHLGEMERDCLIAHGVSMVISERMMLSSDPYEVQKFGPAARISSVSLPLDILVSCPVSAYSGAQ
ncbi:hypothetical protein ZIOFF_066045 [Zingiber officinale]|uniref:DNA-directed RNA polymerase n=1 Tax=Zingiber officinale TaxID=94328 RepID=A0A8J5EY19_ZINOF|nr:hypothetical protein ZIOFF_066045 [Zingiber officinale]